MCWATGVGKGSTLNSCFRSDRYGTASPGVDTIKPASFGRRRGTGELMRRGPMGFPTPSETRLHRGDGRVSANGYPPRQLLPAAQLARAGPPAPQGMSRRSRTSSCALYGERARLHTVDYVRWRAAPARRHEGGAAGERDPGAARCGPRARRRGIFPDNTVNMRTEESCARHTRCCHVCRTSSPPSWALDDALGAVRRVALSNAPFACTEIESTIAERDTARPCSGEGGGRAGR